MGTPVRTQAADLRAMVQARTDGVVLSWAVIGLWTLVGVNLLLAAADLIATPDKVAAVLTLRLVYVGFAIVLFVAARTDWARARAVPLALLVVTAVGAQAIGFASLRGEVTTRALCMIGIGAGASLVVPWGVWPQLVAVTVLELSVLAIVLPAAGATSAVVVYPIAGAGIVFALSLYGAHLLRRSFSLSVERDIADQRAAAALRTIEERNRRHLTQLDALYSTAPVGLALLDTDLRFLRVNEKLANMNGVPADRHIGRTVREVIPDVADTLEPLFRRILETGVPILDLEVSGITARHPGVTRYWRTSYWPVHDSGALVGVSCVVDEITEQMRVQEALRQNEERLRIVSQATNDAVWDWDLATDGLWCNDGMRNLFGYLPTAVGTSASWWYDTIHPDERERVVSGIHSLIDSGQQLWSAEYRFRRGDGSYTHVFDRGFVFHDADGKPRRMIGAMMDISERKRAEDALAKLNSELELRVRERTHALAEANAQLSALIENTNDAIWSIDRTHRLTAFNSIVRQWTFEAHGRSLTIGEPFDVPDEERDYWRPLYNRALTGERILLERDYPIEGEPHSYLISMTPIVAEGEVSGATVYAKDITELRRAEERVRQHQNELTHVLRVNTVGAMAAGLAHEINQPLGAIANYAQGCRRRIVAGANGPDDLLPAIDEIAAQALRAGEIIRRLRRLVQKGRTPHEEADLNAIVVDAVHVIEPQARYQGVVLNVDLSPGLPPVEVDQIQIAQVVLNLMLNGLEAMQTVNRGQPELSVRTAVTLDGSLEVTVGDTGVGLTQAVGDRMFEPFVSSKPSGLGLGLAISRSIVQEHGGRLWATNNADHGATFHVMIPAARRMTARAS